MIITAVDEMCMALAKEEGRQMSVDALASRLDVDLGVVEKLGTILQERDVVEIIYPVNMLQKPALKLKTEFGEKRAERIMGDSLINYNVKANHVSAAVSILDVKNQPRPIYNVAIPEVGPYTSVFLDYVHDELARTVPLQTEEIMDQRRAAGVMDRFYSAAGGMLASLLPGIKQSEKETLAGLLLNRVQGLGHIELVMADDWLEEVALNGAAEPISVYHRKFGWLKTNLRVADEEEIYNYASQIGRRSGKEITLLAPVMDSHLVTGDRVTATMFPISSHGDTITIRRFARDPWTLIDFIDPVTHTLSSDMAAFLWLCVQYEMNIIVVGGTASGKTSMLNAMSALIPPFHRTITIEDTRELNLPSYLNWNWVPLVTRQPNAEGKGEVKMLDLMVSGVRMRPDRIIVGEVRKREEAEVLFEAMHTGHAVYSTMHADTGSQMLRRLTHPPIDLPMTELQSLQLILVQYRDRRSGVRRTYEISEVITSSADMISLNTMYRWKARQDSFEKVNESMRVVEEMDLHTGMTPDEIEDDVNEKKTILEWMLKNHARAVDDIGNVMGVYYKTPEIVIKAAEKNLPVEKVI